jgi:hypothetical protein
MPLDALFGAALAYDNLAVAWTAGPAMLLPFLLLALSAKRERWLVITGLLIATFWAAMTRVDLPEVSVPRVHAPVWVLLAAIGAVGVDVVWRWAEETGARAKVGARAVVVLGWVATAALTVPALYGPTNEDAEEELIQEARHHVEREPPRCLATILSQDPPDPGKTSRAFPNYLFNAGAPPVRIMGLSDLSRSWPDCDGSSVALLGIRCHAAIREDAAIEAPAGDVSIAACEDFRRRWSLEKMIEREVPNRGDLAFPMYPSSSLLRLGLYRVTGPAAGEQ